LGLVVFLATILIYWPTTGYDFVGVDDATFVSENPMVLDGLTKEGLRQAFTEFHASNWVPMTFVSLMVDTAVFGTGPRGYHFTNIFLHALNATLLFFLFSRMTGHRTAAAILALLFALHPMRVESVAWISERKDVLSTAFWLATTLAWVEWVRARRTRYYLLATALFAIGLGAKGMLVTLPFTLLLLDWWPLRRETGWGERVVEKLPLFALSAAGVIVTVLAQASGQAMTALDALEPADRIANAVVGYSQYLERLLWPTKLAYLYPHPSFVPPYTGWSMNRITMAALLLTILSAGALVLLRRGHRHPLSGWLWFLGTLVPVIGILQVGVQSSADRYSYVPHIGLLWIIVATGVELVRARPSSRPAVLVVAGALIVCSAAFTMRELPRWRDSEALFGRALEVTQDNGVAMQALGTHYARNDQPSAALVLLEQAVAVQPRLAGARADLGIVLAAEGRPDEAIPQLRQALTLLPGHALARVALGNALATRGDLVDAAKQYRLALEFDDQQWEAHFGLAQIAYRRERIEAARRHLENALALAPDDATRARIRAAIR
jgi:tetratricopeptide (TPR) repeat protein